MNSIGEVKELANLAHDEPVCVNLPPLAERILEQRHGIEVLPTRKEFYRRFEDPRTQFSADIAVNTSARGTQLFDSSLTTYSPSSISTAEYTGDPYSPLLNELVREDVLSWGDIEETTLSQSAIASQITDRIDSEDVVVVVVVDGLSYADWTRAGYEADPVYVDCPTVTACGYPNVIYGGESGESLANRLHHEGCQNRLAFTYWDKDESALTNLLHESFSSNDIVGDVEDFDDIIAHLKRGDWETDTGTYIQITLTGPERVAHQIKENPDIEHQAQFVHNKLSALNEALTELVPEHRIYATSDHGILWRMDANTDFNILDKDGWHHTDRRCIENPDQGIDVPAEIGTLSKYRGESYLRLQYPHLFHSLRQNEPGVHGGFSYQESIVPLIEIE
jgi:hypothetical protein